MQIVCAIPKEFQNVLYFMVSIQFLKLNGKIDWFLRNIFLKGQQQPDNTSKLVQSLQEEYYQEQTLLQPQVFEVVRNDRPQQYNQMLHVRQRGVKSEAVIQKQHIQLVVNPINESTALMEMFVKQGDILQNLDRDEFERIYMKQIIDNLINGTNRMRSSIIQDQSDFQVFSHTFHQQIKIISNTMRISQT